MKWTVLSDNRTQNPSLQTEHGLSVLLETDKHRILLDTGASDVFIRNAERLGIDLSTVDYVFISHGHSDHAGGLKHFLSINERAKIIISPNAIHGKFFSKRRYLHSITAEWPEGVGERYILIDQTKELCDGLHVIAHIPQKHPMPQGNLHLFVENAEGNYVNDDFRHELALYTDGLLFTGCAHSGLENILSACPYPVKTVVGGFHLLDDHETTKELTELAKRLTEAYPKTQFYTSHCTGDKVFATLKAVMGVKLHAFSCGTIQKEEAFLQLIRLRDEHTIAFKEEMQEAFQHGFESYNKDAGDMNRWQVLPDEDFYQSLNAEGAEAYEAISEGGQRLGGAILSIHKTAGELAFLYVKVGVQSKGIGQSIWKAIEAMHPEIEVWETCTPYFDRRNIHFYINRCGFHAVEFFNEHHPDPNMPRQPNEQREQSDVNISSAESRERKSEAQFDQEDGLFKFEKRMK